VATGQESAAPFTVAEGPIKGGDPVKISFGGPLDESRQRYWICLVEKAAPDSTYGTWAYVDNLASPAVSLVAPAAAGEYEIRLHSDYPAKSSNVVHRVAVTIGRLQPTLPTDMKFTLPASTIEVDKTVTITFPAALVPENGVKFRACLVPAGAPDDAYGLWGTIPEGATKFNLQAATSSGRHEVRLHSNYPKQQTNVVFRLPLEVTGAPDTAPTDLTKLQASVAASVALGEVPTVTFSTPVRPITGEKIWVGFVHADLPATSQGLTTTVQPGAREVKLAKATSTGMHRVKVYSISNPELPQLDLEVTGGPEEAPTDPATLSMKLVSASLEAGQAPVIEFGTKLRARTGERFWLAWIEKDKRDDEWGTYVYVESGENGATLPPVPAPGSYEVRLHANYPTKTSNPVLRIPLEVPGKAE